MTNINDILDKRIKINSYEISNNKILINYDTDNIATLPMLLLKSVSKLQLPMYCKIIESNGHYSLIR